MALSLGIDIGTTKCAAVIFDTAERLLLYSASENHEAALPAAPGCAEQDVGKLLDCVCRTVCSLPQEERSKVTAIGVTGQMHSVMGWNPTTVFPLITWQDQRCGKAGVLEKLSRLSGHTLCDGFGAATLAVTDTEQWQFAATIMDHLVYLLCGNPAPVTDPADAASWGIFDMQTQQWDERAADALGIRRLLPEIVPSGAPAGKLTGQWSRKLGLRSGIEVFNATGDNQTSILGTGSDWEDELYLTLGTGGQLSAVAGAEEKISVSAGGTLEIRPFPGGRQLVVSSCLCGGRAFSFLGETPAGFLRDLGLSSPPLPELLDKIDALGVKAFEKQERQLQMTPSFLGERGCKDLRGSISGITLENLTWGDLAAADAEGILRILLTGFPQELLQKRHFLLGSGNGIRKVQTMQAAIRKNFSQKFVLTNTREEAACGAALLTALKENK